ncbi:YuiA family protein [Bacillus testis]|nr:YuiA family protein [Bacillus testis]
MNATESRMCDYCSGHGYTNLLVGGTETCLCCQGTGIEKD